MEWLLLWLFMVSPKIAYVLTMLGGGMVLLYGGHFFVHAMNNIGMGEEWKSLKKTLVFGVICIGLAALIPTKKDIALIVAGGVSYNVITSDAAKEIGGKTLKILNENLDDYIKEAKDVVKDGAKEAIKETVKK